MTIPAYIVAEVIIMTNFGCNCQQRSCTGLSVAAAVLLGVIATILRITAVITVTPAFLWVVFGIAVVYLAITLVVAAKVRGTGTGSCLCNVLSVLLTGILGTILLSVVLLAITFVATSIVGAIITGLLVLFFTLTIASTACLVKCIARCTVVGDED